MESNPALRYRCKNGHVKLERYKGVDSCVGPCWCGASDSCIEQHPRCACGGNYYIRNDDEASAYCPRCGHKEASNNKSLSELDALRQQLAELMEIKGTPAARFHGLAKELKKHWSDPEPWSAQAFESRFLQWLDAQLKALAEAEAELTNYKHSFELYNSASMVLMKAYKVAHPEFPKDSWPDVSMVNAWAAAKISQERK